MSGRMHRFQAAFGHEALTMAVISPKSPFPGNTPVAVRVVLLHREGCFKETGFPVGFLKVSGVKKTLKLGQFGSSAVMAILTPRRPVVMI